MLFIFIAKLAFAAKRPSQDTGWNQGCAKAKVQPESESQQHQGPPLHYTFLSAKTFAKLTVPPGTEIAFQDWVDGSAYKVLTHKTTRTQVQPPEPPSM